MDPHDRLAQLERSLVATGFIVTRGNAYEPWDLEVVGGLLGSARILTAVEDHGAGKQYVRLGTWPRYSRLGLILIAAGILTACVAFLSAEYVVAGVLAAGSIVLLTASALEAGRSLAAVLQSALKEDRQFSFASPALDSHANNGNPKVSARYPAGPGVAQLQPAAVPRSGADG
jgi:hypothetical protein